MKYGLALGGGGARGAFEAGVWRALREMGKEITVICGTSVGAINGAAFACGADAAALWGEIRAQMLLPGAENENILSWKNLISGVSRLLSGGFDTAPLLKLVQTYIDEDRLRSSGIDYGLCLYSADEKKEAELFLDRIPRGRAAEYITASACFPLLRPIEIDGESLCDGGTRNNLPVNMLLERGCENIISVSVHGPGLLKNIDRRGVNIIEIKGGIECGLMDFNPRHISRCIDRGYYCCKKVFGRLSGEWYYMDNESYKAAVSCLGEDFVGSVEHAAKLCGVEQLREYSFNELGEAVVGQYRSSSELCRMVENIEKDPPCLFHSHLELLRNFDAANAIVYMKNSAKKIKYQKFEK